MWSMCSVFDECTSVVMVIGVNLQKGLNVW